MRLGVFPGGCLRRTVCTALAVAWLAAMLGTQPLGALSFGAQSFGAQPLSGESSLIDDMNPLLGPAYAQWMVGAVGQLVSKQERQEFMALRSDAEAEAFIAAFWQKPEHQLIKQLFDERALEADRVFTEAGVEGRKTDRGTIFILFGPPTEEEIEQMRNVDDPDVLLWTYNRKQTGPGLNGEKPAKNYRFVKVGDLTRRFKKGDRLDPVEQRRRDPLRRPLRPF